MQDVNLAMVPWAGLFLKSEIGAASRKGLRVSKLVAHSMETSNLILKTLIIPEKQTEQGTLVRAAALPVADIVRAIQRDHRVLYEFAKHSRKFEEFLAACYSIRGYDVVLTPPSGDLGIDIIVRATLPGVGTLLIVDQAKARSQDTIVTADDVRALVGVLGRDAKISKGIVTTTGKFAPGVVKEYAHLMPSRLELRDKHSLIQWLETLSIVSRP